jgi:hypothetical protein
MTKTTTDLVNRAAAEMGRLYSGEALSAEDFDTIEELVEPLIDQLNAEKITYVDDLDAILPAVFLPLARLLAIEAAPSFGNGAMANLLSNNRAGDMDALRRREHDTLRRIVAPPATSETMKANYY